VESRANSRLSTVSTWWRYAIVRLYAHFHFMEWSMFGKYFILLILFSGEGKNFLNDEKCYSTVRNVHVITLIIGGSYLFVDLIFVCQVITFR